MSYSCILPLNGLSCTPNPSINFSTEWLGDTGRGGVTSRCASPPPCHPPSEIM